MVNDSTVIDKYHIWYKQVVPYMIMTTSSSKIMKTYLAECNINDFIIEQLPKHIKQLTSFTVCALAYTNDLNKLYSYAATSIHINELYDNVVPDNLNLNVHCGNNDFEATINFNFSTNKVTLDTCSVNNKFDDKNTIVQLVIIHE